MQRELSVRDIRDVRRSLLLNGYVRFPLAGLYLALGVSLGAFYDSSAEFREQVPLDLMDYLVPVFVLQCLPDGIRGLLGAALLIYFFVILGVVIAVDLALGGRGA